MTFIYSQVVRVGIKVTRFDSKWIPFEYRMFHCRQRYPGDETYCAIEDWIRDHVSCWQGVALPGVERLQVGETVRYWVHMRVHCDRDYWGEYDEDAEIIKCRRIS